MHFRSLVRTNDEHSLVLHNLKVFQRQANALELRRFAKYRVSHITTTIALTIRCLGQTRINDIYVNHCVNVV